MRETAIVIGSSESEHLTIDVMGRMHPGSTDRWDGNWLNSPITICVGEFRGHVTRAGLRGDELQSFRLGLENLYADLSGVARLQSMEKWLDLSALGDGLGHVVCSGTVRDTKGSSGTALHFSLELDQTDLPNIISALTAVEAQYPVFMAD